MYPKAIEPKVGVQEIGAYGKTCLCPLPKKGVLTKTATIANLHSDL